MSDNSTPKILVVRNDKLGDFMLSFPVFRYLKQAMPACTLHALVPHYTRDIAMASDDIDDVILDPGQAGSIAEQLQLLQKIKQQQYDAVITLFSTTRIGLLVWLAGINYRLAPATKLAQFFYNHRLSQRRSRSEKPEYRYNLDLAVQYLSDHDLALDIQTTPPFLHFPESYVAEQKQRFLSEQKIDSDPALVMVHPGSGGSANNLSLRQYAQLIQQLELDAGHLLVITAGPGELEKASRLSRLLSKLPHTIYHSQQGLVRFAEFLQAASLFISGSTGPLHLAGALDIPTAAFYPRRRSATSLRWQTLNSETNRLAFMPPANADERDMQSIDISEAARLISEKFL